MTQSRAALLVGILLSACQTAQDSPSATVLPSPSPSPSAHQTTAPTASPAASDRALVWSRVDAIGPTAREDHTWTVDGSGDVAYLFGGRDGTQIFGDLWSYTFASDTWAEVEASGGPPARFGHDAAWVDGVGVVVFAGQAGSAFFNDLWAFDPDAMTWRLLPADGSRPVARYGSCATVGPDGRLWISHGFTSDGVRFDDTRAYDFATGAWTDETPTGTRPIVRCLHRCWWTDDGALALFGGQTNGVTALGDRWILSDGAWTELSGDAPPARNLATHARLADTTLIFGGQGLDGGFLGDLWILPTPEDAQELAPGPGPSPRAGTELVVDLDGQRVLLFGGRGAEGAVNDTWSLDVAGLVG